MDPLTGVVGRSAEEQAAERQRRQQQRQANGAVLDAEDGARKACKMQTPL